MKEIITLNNGLKFVVLSKIVFDGEKYLYLSSYDDDMNIVFVRMNYDKLEPVEDGDLIVNLLKIVQNELK